MSVVILRKFIRETLYPDPMGTTELQNYSSAIMAVIADIIKKSDVFQELGDSDEERLLMVAASICVAGTTTRWGSSMRYMTDQGGAALQAVGSSIFTYAKENIPSIEKDINVIRKVFSSIPEFKRLDATIGPTQIRFSNLAGDEFKTLKDALGISIPTDMLDMTKSILITAKFIHKNYKTAQSLGYSTNEPGNNPNYPRFTVEDSTGNAALDLALCAFNGPTTKVLRRWCKNTKTNEIKPCNEVPQDVSAPAKNYIPRYLTPGTASDEPGTLSWVAYTNIFLPFVLDNLTKAYNTINQK